MSTRHADLAARYPLLTAMAAGQPISEIRLSVTFDPCTSRGVTSLTLRPGVIDEAAVEAYGFSQCKTLAGALADRLGGGFLVVERYEAEDGWRASHYAALTPDGLAVDIHGRRSIAAVVEQVRESGPWPLRHRTAATWAEADPGRSVTWTGAIGALEAEVARTMAAAVLGVT